MIKHSRGMSLVELMVWVTVSLIIIAVMGTVYVNAKQVTLVNDTVSRLQENGRFVIHLLDRDIRMAGFRGCNGASITPTNLLNSTAYPYQYATGMVGYYGTGSSWSPSLDTTLASLTPAPSAQRDVVTIRHIDGAGVPLTAMMASSTSILQVSPGSPLAAGDILLAADCGAAAIFQATSYNAGTGQIGHASGGAAPGNTSNDLGHIFSTNASLFRLVTRTYYVAPSARKANTNSLWAYSVPNYEGVTQPEEMVEGVERLLMLFGEDLDGDRAANRYVTANSVSNWNNVVSVKAQMVLATVRDNTALAPQPYTFNGVTTTPTDRKLRLVMSSMITLRNRVP